MGTYVDTIGHCSVHFNIEVSVSNNLPCFDFDQSLNLINVFDTFQEYEYKMSREYNWNVKSKASKGYEENYFFILREDGFYYDELETR